MSKKLWGVFSYCLLAVTCAYGAIGESYSNLTHASPWWRLDKQTSTIADGGYVLARELRDLDNRSSDDLAALVAAESTFTDPKADLQTYSGTFVNSGVVVEETGERLVTIRHTMLRVSSPTNSATLAAQAYLQMDKNEILDVFSLVTGEKDTRALQWKNINPAQRTTLLAIADSALVSQFGAGYLYVDREFVKQADGTATFSILLQKAAWDAWSGEDIDSWTFLRYSNRGRDRAGLQKTWTGIAIDDATNALNSLTLSTAFITSGYAQTDAYFVDNKDESCNVVQVQVQTDVLAARSFANGIFSDKDSVLTRNVATGLTSGVSVTNGDIVTVNSVLNESGLWDNTLSTNDAKMVTRTTSAVAGPLQTSSSTSVMNDTNEVAASESGSDIVTISNTKNEHGLWDTTIDGKDGVAASGTATDGSVLVGTSVAIGRNQAAAPTMGAGSAGVIHGVTASLNEFGLWDTKESTSTAAAAAGAASAYGGPLTAESLTVKANQTNVPALSAGSAGTINSASYSINQFGLYDTRESVRTASAASTSVTGGGPLSGVSIAIKRNQTNAPTLGAGSAGTINDASASINEFGLYDTRESVRTATAASASVTGGGPLVSVAIGIKRNQTNAPALGAGSAGTINDASASINEFGLYDTRESVRTATAASGTGITYGGPIVSEGLTVKRNQTNAPSVSAGTAGTINSASYSINEFGLYDTRESTRTAAAADGNSITYGGPIVSEALTVKRNQTNTPSVTAGSAGTINSASYSINDFGLYDTRESVRTATAASASITGGGPLVGVAIDIKRNQTNAPTLGAGSAGTINDVSASINEFGLYDTRESVRTSTAAAGGTSTYGGPLVAETLVAKRNQTSQPTPAAGSAGTINSVSYSLNEFGRYDTREAVRTATAVAGAQITYGGPVVTEAITVKRNQTAVPSVSAGSAGTINSAAYGINEFGRYDTRESTRTAVAVAGAQITYGGPIIAETLTVKRNQTAVPSVSAGSAGTINSAAYSINEFGRYDTRESSRTATASSNTVTYGSVFESSVETAYRNLTAPISPSAGSAGTVTRASGNVNQFGVYDGRSITSTSKTASVSSFTSVDDEYGTTAQVQEYNAATIPNAADTATTEQSISGRLNRFGKYDYTKTTRTAVLPTGYSYTLYGQYYWNYTYFEGNVISSVRRVRGWLYTITFHNNAVDAATAIASGYKGSSVARMAVRVWRATKVTKGTDINAGW